LFKAFLPNLWKNGLMGYASNIKLENRPKRSAFPLEVIFYSKIWNKNNKFQFIDKFKRELYKTISYQDKIFL